MRPVAEVTYGGTKVAFRLVRAKRKTMEIAVHPDQRVVVKAPWGASTDKVAAKVKKRARWILRQQDFFAQFKPRTPIRRYISGETHLYLGRPYRLKLVPGGRKSVFLNYRILVISGVAGKTNVKNELEKWYREKAKEIFKKIFEELWERFKLKQYSKPTLHVRRMTRRWGSHAESNALTLNLELIRAPKMCIEYVVAHELCHLHHRDHGPAFFSLLEEWLPDWEKRKQRLELALI